MNIEPAAELSAELNTEKRNTMPKTHIIRIATTNKGSEELGLPASYYEHTWCALSISGEDREATLANRVCLTAGTHRTLPDLRRRFHLCEVCAALWEEAGLPPTIQPRQRDMDADADQWRAKAMQQS